MPGSALIGNLAVNLSLETAAFQSGATIAEKRMTALGKKFETIGANVTKAGLIFTAGITLPLVAFGKQAVQAAQDAQEMNSAFDVVFGGMADGVRKWAETTGNLLGRSTQEMQRGALAFQELFGKALDPQKSAQMSKAFAVLTQDLASFKNLSNEVAQQKLFSGLAGEAEPLRAVGVFLSEAKVQAAALEMGLVGVNGKLSEEQKILARAAVIQKELANAQGDVIRTADGAANKSKQLAAQYEEVSVKLGTTLLPLKVKLAEVAIRVLEVFDKLSPTTQTWVVGIGAAAAALGPFMLVLGPVIMGVGKLLPLIVALGPAFTVLRIAMLALLANPIVLGAAAVIAGIYLAWKHWDKISAIVERVYTAVKTWMVDKLNAVWKWVTDKIASVTNAFRAMYNAVVGNSYVPDMVEGIAQSMAQLQQIMVDPALNATQKVGAAFQSLANLIGGLFGQKAGSIIGAIGQLATALGPLFGGRGFDSASFAATEASNFKAMGMARGGSGVFGGRSGVDRNLLSLNGSPIARVSRGEHFSVSPNASPAAKVMIVPTPYFDAHVQGQAVAVAAPMAGQAAIMGASGGMAGVHRRYARTLP